MLCKVLTESRHEVVVSDLYAINFKAMADWQDFTDNNIKSLQQYEIAQQQAYQQQVLSEDIKQEQAKLLWCDTVVFQFPFWRFSTPAILKSWFDRVLTLGYAYEKGKWFDKGLLQPRRAILTLTTQALVTSYGADGLNGDINQLLMPLHYTLRFVGLTPLMPFVAYGVMTAEENTRQKYIYSYGKHLLSLDCLPPLPFNALDDFDEKMLLKPGKERV